ncbi:MFS transporter [Calidithermus roseus]|nr:MFS transporter [Calidithermus roseus]
MQATPPYSSIFRNPAFLAFWAAQTVSSAGDAVRRMTLLLWVFAESGQSGLAIAAITVAETVPYLLLSPLAGVFVDRFNRRAILVGADLARALLSLALVYAVVSHSLWLVYPVILLATLFSAVAEVAAGTVLPRVVEDRQLEQGNGLLVIGQQAALIAGPALGAVLYTTVGPGVAFVADAATFLLSALLIGLALPPHRLQPTESGTPSRGRSSLWGDIRAGLRYLLGARLILANFAITSTTALAAGINGTVMIFFITRTLGHNAPDLAWLAATNGVAQMLVGGYVVWLAHRARLERLLAASLGLMALGATLVAAAWSLPVLVLGVILTSLGNAPFNIARDTLDQRYVPLSYLGRVRSAVDMSTTALFLAASSLSGYLVPLLEPRALLSASATISVIVALAGWLVLVPLLKRASPPSEGSVAAQGQEDHVRQP